MDALQVVADPKRREILRLVWDGERSAGEIADSFDVTFGAISQHLAVLREAGFVSVSRRGNRRLYVANQEALGDLRNTLEALWAGALDSLVDTVGSRSDRDIDASGAE